MCQGQNACYHGWLPFWTPAERVGLKAMGGLVKDDPFHEVVDAIRAYVKAAREIKERE